MMDAHTAPNPSPIPGTMIRIDRISTFSGSGAQRAAAAWQTAASQPSWVARAALLVFLIVVGLPLLALFLVALFLATIVFAVLAGVNFVLLKIRGILPRNDGRENVRVIQRR